MALKVQSGIMSIDPYQGGKSKIEGRNKVIKLSSNENPLGASPKALEAYRNAEQNLFRYPDGAAELLREAIGEVHNIDPARLVCGAGSDEIISLLCKAFCGEGDEVLYSEYGFLMYKIAALSCGAKPVAIKEQNLTADLDAILAAINPRTRIIFLANPNNPTGTYVNKTTLEAFVAKLPKDVLLVIDGAYSEYVYAKDYICGLDLAGKYENVVVCRTFSKIYALAGLRVGWCYGGAQVIDVLNRVRGPFNVSLPAIDAASAAVRDVEYTKKSVAHNLECLELLRNGFNRIGLGFIDSQANFLLADFKTSDRANAAFDYLINNDVIVRKTASYNLPQYLRITIGLKSDCELVLQLLEQFQKN